MSRRLSALLLSVFLSVPVGLSFYLPAAAEIAEANRLNASARTMLKQGRAAEALTLAQKAVSLNPRNAGYRETLMLVYVDLGKDSDALREAYRQVELSPADGLCHFNLASILHRLGQSKEALPEYDKAVQLGETATDVRTGRAICLIENGYYSEAVPELEQLSDEEPGNKHVWRSLGWAYMQYGDMEASVNAAKKSLEIDPDYYDGWKLRAHQAKKSHDYHIAIEAGKRMLAADPREPYGYWFLGKLSAMEWSRHLEIARQVLTKAINNTPQSSGLFFELGKAYWAKARSVSKYAAPSNRIKAAAPWLDLATDAFRQCVKVSPDNAEANLEMARLLLSRRQWREAYPYAKRAHDAMPNEPDVERIYRQSFAARNDLAGWLRQWFQQIFQTAG